MLPIEECGADHRQPDGRDDLLFWLMVELTMRSRKSCRAFAKIVPYCGSGISTTTHLLGVVVRLCVSSMCQSRSPGAFSLCHERAHPVTAYTVSSRSARGVQSWAPTAGWYSSSGAQWSMAEGVAAVEAAPCSAKVVLTVQR